MISLLAKIRIHFTGIQSGSLCMALLSTCGMSWSAEPGWEPGGKHPALEQREYLRQAMRQKKDDFYLIEHRWISKPTGAFQELIATRFAPFSQANRDKRAKLAPDEMPFLHQYEGKEWWLVMRTIIAINRHDAKAESLISPQSTKELIESLQISLEGMPKFLEQKKTKPGLSMDLSKEPAEIYQPLGIPWQSDEILGSVNGGFDAVLMPAVTSWYARQGAPYVQAPHVVQSFWFWHEFVEQKNISDYVAASQKKFDADNLGLPHPIKFLDIRTPIK